MAAYLGKIQPSGRRHAPVSRLRSVVGDIRPPIPSVAADPAIRPLVHDYLQRYLPYSSGLAEYSFLVAARLAERVLVTTKFTEGDALQYGGIDPERVFHVPMLAPQFEPVEDLPALANARILSGRRTPPFTRTMSIRSRRSGYIGKNWGEISTAISQASIRTIFSMTSGPSQAARKFGRSHRRTSEQNSAARRTVGCIVPARTRQRPISLASGSNR